MPAPSHSLAYEDAFELFDKALADPVGIRIPCESSDAALTLRFRLNNARVANRRDNAQVYELGDPMYGKSEYDQLICRIKIIETVFYVYIERTRAPTTVESLSTLENRDETPSTSESS